MILPLAINRLYFLYPLEKARLWEELRDEGDFRNLNIESLSRIIGRKISVEKVSIPPLLQMAYHDSQWLHSMHVSVVQYADPCYPPLLREIYDPPFLLMYRGNLRSTLERIPVAVVGTRRPDPQALIATREFTEGCRTNQIVVVSGLAKGIDAAAHEGAVDHTCSVLGSGVDVIYPRQNQHLARRILQSEGCLLSEYPLGTPPRPHHFIARNRIISGMSHSVIIMQAPVQSGALITARYGLEQGRDVYVHEVGMRMEGTRKLVEEGAPLIKHAEELFIPPLSNYMGHVEEKIS